MLLAGFSVKGSVSEGEVMVLIEDVITTIEVLPAHVPAMYSYPVVGKGGKGFTFIQPITESFIAFDAWPDHGGGYLIISSCKYFSPPDVRKVIERRGLKVTGMMNEGLTLVCDAIV